MDKTTYTYIFVNILQVLCQVNQLFAICTNIIGYFHQALRIIQQSHQRENVAEDRRGKNTDFYIKA